MPSKIPRQAAPSRTFARRMSVASSECNRSASNRRQSASAKPAAATELRAIKQRRFVFCPDVSEDVNHSNRDRASSQRLGETLMVNHQLIQKCSGGLPNSQL